MSPRPYPRVGSYVRAKCHGKHHPTKIVCKGYYAAPSVARVGSDSGWLGNIEPGTYLGPIAAVDQSERYVSVFINGWWINIWSTERGGTTFAFPVPDQEVRRWVRRGWQHRFQST